jgi:ATP-binding cassette subfamily B multidrug efflux pump
VNEVWRTLGPDLWRYRRGLALGMGALALKDVLAAALPLLVRATVDSVEAGLPIQRLLWLAAAMVALSAAKGFFQYWMRVILIGVSRDIEYDIRNRLFAHLMTLSSTFYSKYRTGDIMARATNDLNAVRMMLGPGVMYWTETSLTFVFALAVMLWVDWRLTLIALLPAPLISVTVVVFGRLIHERFERIQAIFSDISSRVQESLAGIRVLRAYTQEDAELARFETLNRGFIRQNMRLVWTSGFFMPLLQAFVGCSFLLVLWAGGKRLLEGEISVGTFLMFNFYMGMLVWPMIAMGWVVNLMQRGSASLKRLNQIMAERPTIHAPPEPVRISGQIRGEIRFENVELRYQSGASSPAGGHRDGDGEEPFTALSPGPAPALIHITLTIPAGSTVAIVGHTGSGKTSLLNLIGRLYDPTSGRVLLDGIDLREFDPAELRRWIGYVPQETFLFSATLAENIALGAPKASREEIHRAAELAGLGPDLATFPDGLDTRVGERGLTLSGGQKQRTAIARAILRNPHLLILDDALSSVDTITEERILLALADVMKERTTILVSHRVSTIRHADRIFVLERGRLAEEGTHDKLLAADGYYADLYRKQLLEEELETI